MKILMMHRGDGELGGGQVQMNRLCAGLQSRGVEARILCRHKSRSDSVLMPTLRWVERPLRKLTRRLGFNEIHLVSSFGLRNLPEFRDADAIDLHCLHCETLSYLALPTLTAAKAAIFTFHDMWPITAHCHASLECDRWKSGCGKCPHLDIAPEVMRDATALEWKFKRWSYNRSKLTIVTPSKWLYDRTRESMLGEFPVHHIPHGIETDIFLPLDKSQCKCLLGISPVKRVLLCAMESMQRPLKGADLLVEALRNLPASLQRESVLLLFGHASPEIIKRIEMPVVNLGYVHHSRLKVLAFSAADVFVNPTRADNFPLVVLESMACGTPVVSFGVGGVPEMVRPGVTGYLAKPESSQDLSEGILRMLDDKTGRESMAAQCRQVVLSEYPLGLQVQRYIDLYRQVIDATP